MPILLFAHSSTYPFSFCLLFLCNSTSAYFYLYLLFTLAHSLLCLFFTLPTLSLPLSNSAYSHFLFLSKYVY